MIVFYVILAGHFGYFSLLAVNALAFKKLKVAKSQGNENVAINPHITYLGNESASPRPNYKKKNLTIEIPDLAIEGEDTEVRFIKKYYKAQCFPMMLASENNTKISKNARITIWFTLLICEIYVNSQILLNDAIAVSSFVACLICSPISCVLTIVFRFTNSLRWFFVVFGYGVVFVLSIVLTFYSRFVEIDKPELFVTSCVILVFMEMVFMEPIRTLVKAIALLIAKEFDVLVEFYENL